jgi:putative ABC transport system permease protein
MAAAVVATLAMGIGANTAIFSAVDAVLLKPLPYPDADRLVAVYELNQGLKQATQLVAPVRLESWNRENRTLAGLAGSYFENQTDTTGATPERVESMRISPRFFAVLGVGAALGRTPTADEDRFGGPAVVVVSDAFWRRRFDADPRAVGSALIIGGVSRTIVGIMPPSFRYPTATTELWVPAQMPAGLMRERRARFYTAVGRLKPGVTVEEAQGDLAAVQARLGEEFPETDRGWSASIVPLKEEQVGGARRSLWLLLAAVALLLLAACGNVACLLLADATRREHEIAVRFAIGASRAAVVRQLVTEGAVLAIAGAASGLLLARWAAAWLRQLASSLPRIEELRVDGRLVVFAMALGAVTTIVFAVAPALQAARVNPGDALARGGRGQTAGRRLVQRTLVSGQIALACVLLVGAGLLIRSFARIAQVSPGFDPSGVITFRMSASWSESAASVIARQARTVHRLEEIPGVEAAAVSQTMPAAVNFPPGQFVMVGRETTQKLFAHGRMVSGSYFRTLRIPILQGETCSTDASAPLFSKALVTRAFVERYFPGENPIGHALTSPGFPPGTSVSISGVVGDVRESGLVHDPEPLIYWCGYSPYWPDPQFIVRTNPARHVGVAAIRAALIAIEPKRAMYAARTLDETLAATVSPQRLNTLLLGLFAVTALMLAGVGVYGVLAQLVAARVREIGVRMALGARGAQIVAPVVAQAVAMAAAGGAIGVAASLALARFMSALVFGISPRDPLTFGGVVVVLPLVAAAAALVPARRAAAIDPMVALRE